MTERRQTIIAASSSSEATVPTTQRRSCLLNSVRWRRRQGMGRPGNSALLLRSRPAVSARKLTLGAP